MVSSISRSDVHIALLVHHFINLLVLVASKQFLYSGKVPYKELGNTVILSSVLAGYRLDSPDGCPNQM